MTNKKNKSLIIKKKNSGPRKKRAFLVGKLKWHMVAGALIFLLVLGVLGYYFVFSDEFTIEEFTVSGAGDDLEEEIHEHYEYISSKDRLFFVPQNKTITFPRGRFADRVLEESPKARNIEVEISIPDSLHATVEERTMSGVWCAYSENSSNSSSCFFYDADGVIYEKSPEAGRGALLVSIRDFRYEEAELGQVVMNEELVDYLDRLLAALDFVYENPSYITIESQNEVSLGFAGGWEAHFSRDFSIIEQVENMVLVIEEEIGVENLDNLSYIDARLGNKIFYKME